ncbi:hypothetical protein ABDI49_21870 [Bacillus cereus]
MERNAWACGDGNGAGNRKCLGVEMCCSKRWRAIYKAEDNAAIVVAQL